MTDDIERRLRGALTARAGQITQERLRFGVPPTVAVPRARPRWLRWLPMTAGVAAAAAVLTFTLLPGTADPEPVLPGGPAVTTPSSSPAASPVSPRPTSSPSSVPSTPSPSTDPRPVTSAPAVVESRTASAPATGLKTPDGPAATPGG